jgi:hypothetical protein
MKLRPAVGITIVAVTSFTFGCRHTPAPQPVTDGAPTPAGWALPADPPPGSLSEQIRQLERDCHARNHLWPQVLVLENRHAALAAVNGSNGFASLSEARELSRRQMLRNRDLVEKVRQLERPSTQRAIAKGASPTDSSAPGTRPVAPYSQKDGLWIDVANVVRTNEKLAFENAAFRDEINRLRAELKRETAAAVLDPLQQNQVRTSLDDRLNWVDPASF